MKTIAKTHNQSNAELWSLIPTDSSTGETSESLWESEEQKIHSETTRNVRGAIPMESYQHSLLKMTWTIVAQYTWKGEGSGDLRYRQGTKATKEYQESSSKEQLTSCLPGIKWPALKTYTSSLRIQIYQVIFMYLGTFWEYLGTYIYREKKAINLKRARRSTGNGWREEREEEKRNYIAITKNKKSIRLFFKWEQWTLLNDVVQDSFYRKLILRCHLIGMVTRTETRRGTVCIPIPFVKWMGRQ